MRCRFLCALLTILASACSRSPRPAETASESPLPLLKADDAATPPSPRPESVESTEQPPDASEATKQKLDELVCQLVAGSKLEQQDAAFALEAMGKDAIDALPALYQV